MISLREVAEGLSVTKGSTDDAGIPAIDNTQVLNLVHSSIRQVLAEQEGTPYDPKGRGAETVQEYQYEAIREASRMFFLYDIPHEVWCDESREEPFWWLEIKVSPEFRWFCQVCSNPNTDADSVNGCVASTPPRDVDMDAELVQRREPWESDRDWYWNAEEAAFASL